RPELLPDELDTGLLERSHERLQRPPQLSRLRIPEDQGALWAHPGGQASGSSSGPTAVRSMNEIVNRPDSGTKQSTFWPGLTRTCSSAPVLTSRGRSLMSCRSAIAPSSAAAPNVG